MNVSDLSVLYIACEKQSNKDIENNILKNANKLFCSSTIEDAKHKYKKFSPCLLIIESSFKNIEIINFLHDIRKDDIKTAFIIITNSVNNIYLSKLMELYITKYIVKPFSNDELSQALYKCMEIIERRIHSNIELEKGIFFNFQTQSIIKDNIAHTLNKKEALLINYFIQNQNRIISYEELEYHIWNEPTTKAALKSLIRDFRKKTHKNIIKNYSGQGYKFELKPTL